jgi:hypothetical protein
MLDSVSLRRYGSLNDTKHGRLVTDTVSAVTSLNARIVVTGYSHQILRLERANL